jgi:hypothetical protein
MMKLSPPLAEGYARDAAGRIWDASEDVVAEGRGCWAVRVGRESLRAH